MSRYLLLLALGLAACSDEGPVRPAPLPGASAKPTTPEPNQPFSEPKRTVETRMPWGGPAGNMLVDGDFEHSISYESYGSQTGWIAVSQQAQVGLRGETGGLCKSGLQCAVLTPGLLLLGKGVAARGVGMTASVWAKPPAARSCSVVSVYLVGCSQFTSGRTLAAASDSPDPSGWCFYQSTVSPQDEGVCMIVESELAMGETALVDAARLLPNDGTSGTLPGAGAGMDALTGERAVRARALGEQLRKQRRFGLPPESPLQKIGER